MKNKAAVELGRRGGRARKRNLTPEELSAIGRRGAQIRWKKNEDESEPNIKTAVGFHYPKRRPKKERREYGRKQDRTDHN